MLPEIRTRASSRSFALPYGTGAEEDCEISIAISRGRLVVPTHNFHPQRFAHRTHLCQRLLFLQHDQLGKRPRNWRKAPGFYTPGFTTFVVYGPFLVALPSTVSATWEEINRKKKKNHSWWRQRTLTITLIT